MQPCPRSAGPTRAKTVFTGAFGAAASWKDVFRSDVDRWVKSSPVVDEVVARLTAHTRIGPKQKSGLVDWVSANLVDEISTVASGETYLQELLSERLANAGILPMFGFPTRVRELYGGRPRPGRPAREMLDLMTVSSRQLDIAIGQFAPGAEVLRDKQVHVAAGLAAYRIVANKLEPVDPLGPPRYVRRCSACGSVDPAQEPVSMFVPSAGPTSKRSPSTSRAASDGRRAP